MNGIEDYHKATKDLLQNARISDRGSRRLQPDQRCADGGKAGDGGAHENGRRGPRVRQPRSLVGHRRCAVMGTDDDRQRERSHLQRRPHSNRTGRGHALRAARRRLPAQRVRHRHPGGNRCPARLVDGDFEGRTSLTTLLRKDERRVLAPDRNEAVRSGGRRRGMGERGEQRSGLAAEARPRVQQKAEEPDTSRSST